MSVPLLTAQWRDLVLVSYPVDPDLLAPRVPAGTELDLHDGRCWVSLVAFMFVDTRLLRVPVPGHRTFPEVNLRFYVSRRHGDEMRRGVVFIKELVPRIALAAVARIGYGEPYERWHLTDQRSESEVAYAWWRGASRSAVRVGRGESLGTPQPGSHEEFITEHYWGYTRRSAARTDEYQVEHPTWNLHDATNARVAVDFAGTYGPGFAFLADTEPGSVLVADGSPVSIHAGRRLDLPRHGQEG